MIHDQKREDSQKKDEKAAGAGVLIPNVCYKTTGPRICGYYVEEAASYIKLKLREEKLPPKLLALKIKINVHKAHLNRILNVNQCPRKLNRMLII